MAEPTKFQQLCDAYKSSRANFFRYRDSCIELLARVAEQLARDWEIPNLRLVPLDRQVESDKRYFPHGATHYDFDDGYFHMGVAFSVYTEPNTFPQDGVVVRLSARQEAGKFMLSVAKREAKNVGAGDPDKVRAVLDELFGILDAEYVRTPEALRRAKPDEPERRVIGFVNDKGEDR